MVSFNSRIIKTPTEQAIMREGGQIMAKIMKHLKRMVEPDIDEWELETAFLRLCEKYGVSPSCKGYAPYRMPPFPTGLCISKNKQSVHNPAKRGKKLREGDIVTIDTVIEFEGFHLDSAFSTAVGETSTERIHLLKTTKQALDEAISLVRDGVRTGVISNTIQTIAFENGFDVLREYTGHGIGREMHEWPEIPCYGEPGEGSILRAGMVVCIEPLICENKHKIKHLNAWETELEDGGDFCQMEHTVLVKKRGCEILTA